MLLKITQKHIDAATVGHCPIEVAMDELLDKKCFAGYTFVGLCDGSRKWKLPHKARPFAQAFDMGDEVKPAEFELEETVYTG